MRGESQPSIICGMTSEQYIPFARHCKQAGLARQGLCRTYLAHVLENAQITIVMMYLQQLALSRINQSHDVHSPYTYAY